MNQTIRVIGEKETAILARLKDEGERLAGKAKVTHHFTLPLHNGIFFAPVADKKYLGRFTIPEKYIILSEEILSYPYETIRNIFIHEFSHALDYAVHGCSTGHSSEFRAYCREFGIDDGFDKSTLKRNLEEKEKTERKVEKLLALSSSPFENEALLALSKAQKLLAEMGSTPKEEKTEKIYETDLYESGRTPLYVTRLLSFVQKATGVCVVKCQSEAAGIIARAYGELEEVEAALYLFGTLEGAVDEEVKKLRRLGHKVTKDSFVLGAIPEMERKLLSYDSAASSALVVIRDQNLRKAKRLVFSDMSLRTTKSRGHITSPESYGYGREFGKNLDFEKRPGTKKLT